jgi:hypothetical protein
MADNELPLFSVHNRIESPIVKFQQLAAWPFGAVFFMCLSLTACLGPFNPNTVDEKGIGPRQVALYSMPWNPANGGSCQVPRGGAVLKFTQQSSSDGKFSFPDLAQACYRVVDTAQPSAIAASWIHQETGLKTLNGRVTVKEGGTAIQIRLCQSSSPLYKTLACN